jgi:hypothetical protein
MIPYQLPNGKVIHITVDQFLNMSDDDFKLANEMNIGRLIHNPFEKIGSNDEDLEPLPDEPLELLSEDDEPSAEIDLDSLFLDDESLI